jgi:hypothetical protein
MFTKEERVENQLKQILMTKNQKQKNEYRKWEEKAMGKHRTHKF